MISEKKTYYHNKFKIKVRIKRADFNKKLIFIFNLKMCLIECLHEDIFFKSCKTAGSK